MMVFFPSRGDTELARDSDEIDRLWSIAIETVQILNRRNFPL